MGLKIAILTNGEYGDYSFCKELDGYDQVISADNGLYHAMRLGITPDHILGDFDSLHPETAKRMEELGLAAEVYPSQKDQTDTELALWKAFELGASEVDILGGVGSRMDHSLGNIHLLYQALQKGVKVRLLNPHNTIQMIEDRACLQGKEGDLVSLLPFTPEVTGITTTNLAYAVENGTFTMGNPIGVSNYMTAKDATVTIQSGILLVIEARD